MVNEDLIGSDAREKSKHENPDLVVLAKHRTKIRQVLSRLAKQISASVYLQDLYYQDFPTINKNRDITPGIYLPCPICWGFNKKLRAFIKWLEIAAL